MHKRTFLYATIFLILFCFNGFVVAQNTPIVSQNPQGSATSIISPINEQDEAVGYEQPSNPQAGTVDARSTSGPSNSGSGSPNPATEGNIANPIEAPRIGVVCGGNSEGDVECKSFDKIVISDDGIYTQQIAPTSTENQQTSFPEWKDTGNIPEEMLYRVIDKNLLAASRQAISINPKFIFHIKIYFKAEQVSWEKTIPRLENEIGITIRETDT